MYNCKKCVLTIYKLVPNLISKSNIRPHNWPITGSYNSVYLYITIV